MVDGGAVGDRVDATHLFDALQPLRHYSPVEGCHVALELGERLVESQGVGVAVQIVAYSRHALPGMERIHIAVNNIHHALDHLFLRDPPAQYPVVCKVLAEPHFHHSPFVNPDVGLLNLEVTAQTLR